MLAENEQKVYEILKKLGISYIRYKHPPVFTAEQAEQYRGKTCSTHCKNLFLRNKKGNRHYLIIFDHSKKADLNQLTKQLGEDRLSFASDKRLMQHLGLSTGAVSPFGLINDTKKHVSVVLDQDMKKAERINFHPNVNTATVEIEFEDFEKFIAWCGNSVCYLQL